MEFLRRFASRLKSGFDALVEEGRRVEARGRDGKEPSQATPSLEEGGIIAAPDLDCGEEPAGGAPPTAPEAAPRERREVVLSPPGPRGGLIRSQNPLSAATDPDALFRHLSVAEQLWVGWHEAHGWVLLDRWGGLNARHDIKGSVYWYVLPARRQLIDDSQDSFRSGTGLRFAPRQLARLKASARGNEFEALVGLCQSYLAERDVWRGQLLEAEGSSRRTSIWKPDHPVEPDLEEQSDFRDQADEAGLLPARAATPLERMLDAQRRDRDEMLRFLEKRGISRLVHFTRTDNLAGILRNGIVPRCLLPEDTFRFNDERRLDGHLDASCLSITLPNYKMFYKYRCEDPAAAWAVVVIDSRALTELPCLFHRSNAASSCERARPIDDCLGLSGLAAMFEDHVPPVRDAWKIGSNHPTDAQAEVLVFQVIPPEMIAAVHIDRNDDALVSLIRDLGDGPRLVRGGGELFQPRFDWERERISSVRSSDMDDFIPF